jgi:sensor histidine kinase YesM
LQISYSTVSPTQLLCTVRDNGVGIQTQSQQDHESKGLKMTREKLSLLPGYTENSLEVDCEKGRCEVRVLIFFGKS